MPAIELQGVGNRADHNLIHDAPHWAISFGGNEHVMELNEIYDVCQETGDVGVFYTGRDWTRPRQRDPAQLHPPRQRSGIVRRPGRVSRRLRQRNDRFRQRHLQDGPRHAHRRRPRQPDREQPDARLRRVHLLRQPRAELDAIPRRFRAAACPRIWPRCPTGSRRGPNAIPSCSIS